MAIAQKEINEAIYWIELFNATNYLDKDEFESINENAIELITSIIKSTKSNLKNNG
jgi:four helix bundle protein